MTWLGHLYELCCACVQRVSAWNVFCNINVYVRMYMYTCGHMYICIHRYMYICVCICICTSTYIHTHTYIYIFIFIPLSLVILIDTSYVSNASVSLMSLTLPISIRRSKMRSAIDIELHDKIDQIWRETNICSFLDLTQAVNSSPNHFQVWVSCYFVTRNYPIVNLNSRKDSWYQGFSVFNMVRHSSMSIPSSVRLAGNRRKFIKHKLCLFWVKAWVSLIQKNTFAGPFPIIPIQWKITEKRKFCKCPYAGRGSSATCFQIQFIRSVAVLQNVFSLSFFPEWRIPNLIIQVGIREWWTYNWALMTHSWHLLPRLLVHQNLSCRDQFQVMFI